MKTNQKSFGIAEILIVVVVVGLLGVAGWLVYDRQKSKTDNNKANTPVSRHQEKQETPKETEHNENTPDGWKKYDSNSQFSFVYPKEWGAVVKVSEYPVSEVFEIRYVGEVKLNEKLDGWIYANAENGTTVGAKADVTQEETNNSLKIWRFGFGDAGYSSLIPTFVAKGKIYQITTGNSCPEKTANCMAGEEYEQAYNKLVESIRLR
jgi:Tfp pilus assembly protein PilE